MLALRAAEWRDLFLVLRLRNDLASRRWSPSQERIGMWTHLGWWIRRPRSDETVFVVIRDRERVGYVRVERPLEGFSKVSVAISQGFRGQGLGGRALQLALLATSHTAGLEGWAATIHRDNVPSLRAFTSAGFRHDSETLSQEGPFIRVSRSRELLPESW